MFTTPSSDATAMAWNWVIQSIAKFKQVDSSTLVDLVEKAPAISVDMEKDTKEMVSLRMLESLFLHESEATVDTESAQNDKISFDLSENCEDILHRILEETSKPMKELERRKWNIGPFIIHKRASLPKPPIQKFKGALLEGTRPILGSLKDMSTKLTRDETGKDDLVFQITENRKSKLQERCLQKSVHVEASSRGVKGDIGRKEHEMTIVPTEETEHVKSKLQELPLQKSDHVEASNNRITGDIGRKEHEMTIVPTEKSKLQELPLQKSDHVEASNNRIIGDIGRKEHEITIEPTEETENEKSELQELPLQKSDHVEASNNGITGDMGRKEHEMTIEPTEETENEKCELQELPLPKSDHVEASNNGITGDIGRKEHEMTIEPTEETENETSELQELPLQNPDHAEASNKGIKGDIGRKEHEMSIEPLEENTLMDHVEHIVPDSLEESSDHADRDHGQHQPPSDDDESTDIAAQKEASLSSKDTLNHDFTSTADFSEIFVCMKCNNKGGKLLVCGSNACPFRVHESCLDSAGTLDENPIFFCPLCSYSHAISMYMEVKKKAALARKDLQAFLSSGVRVRHRPKISSKTGACLDENTSTQAGAMGEKFKLDGNGLAMSRDRDCALPDTVHELTCQAGMTEPPSSERASPVSSMSSHPKRNRRQEPQYTSPTITLARRTNLVWEKSEEEVLKEGVRKFSCGDSQRIPWKKILEFGRDVLDKSRTTIDLKDKWRNMCKENTTVKKQKL